MTQVTLKTIEQNDNVGMFSICFDGNSESEFEKFLMEFKSLRTMRHTIKTSMPYYWLYPKLSIREH